jgi:hypothetical protein
MDVPDVSRGMAVVTRTGGLVHWHCVGFSRVRAQTVCGREYIDLHTPDASIDAVTCSVCRRVIFPVHPKER